MGNKPTVFGRKKPRNTKRNLLIKKAVRKAVKDYRETFLKLANT